jgi:hypothetical protein
MKKSDDEKKDEKNVCHGGEKDGEKKAYYDNELSEIVRAFLLNTDNYRMFRGDSEVSTEHSNAFVFDELERMPEKASGYVEKVFELWMMKKHAIDVPISVPEDSSVCKGCMFFDKAEICLGCGHSCMGEHIPQLCITTCTAGDGRCKNQTIGCSEGYCVCFECLQTTCGNCGNPKYDANGDYSGFCDDCSVPYTDIEPDSDSDSYAD